MEYRVGMYVRQLPYPGSHTIENPYIVITRIGVSNRGQVQLWHLHIQSNGTLTPKAYEDWTTPDNVVALTEEELQNIKLIYCL